MKNNNLIKVQIEHKNAIGMPVFVNKKVSKEELELLQAREDVKVILVGNFDSSKIA